MTDAQNPGGWPDAARPGVPKNPEQSGAHRLRHHGSDLEWDALWSCGGTWLDLSGDFSTTHAAAFYDYLGPCLTPAEVAVRVERAEAERDALQARCEACALFTGTPGAMTVNCVRGTVRCTERERIEAERDRNLEALAELAQRYAREGLAERARAERAEAEAARLRRALIAARGFIRNGVECGSIRMPDAGTADTAHDTLPMIEAALAAKHPGHENTPETEVGRP